MSTFYGIHDPAWSFTGSWGEINAPASTSGALRYTSTPGDTASITYSEASAHLLQLRLQRASDGPIANVRLDGAEPIQISTTGDLANVDFVVAEGVGSGAHAIELTHGGGGTFLYLDGLQVAVLVPLPVGDSTPGSDSLLYRGSWYTMADGVRYTSDLGTPAELHFASYFPPGAKLSFETTKASDTGQVEVFANGFSLGTIDLYSATPVIARIDLPIPTALTADSGTIRLKLVLRAHQWSSTGNFFYVRAVNYTPAISVGDAIQRMIGYVLRQQNADGAIKDAWDIRARDGVSALYNMDANSLYACIGLLFAYASTQDARIPEAVRQFLVWFADRQRQCADPFEDGSWGWGYKDDGSGGYVETVEQYADYGITQLRWVDAIHCLGVWVLWKYHQITQDDATLAQLLPVFRRGIDGYLRNCYDAPNALFYSSWQYKPAGEGWVLFDARYVAGQGDVSLGLWAAYQLTGDSTYSNLLTPSQAQLDSRYDTGDHYGIGIFGDPPSLDAKWYPFGEGWTPLVRELTGAMVEPVIRDRHLAGYYSLMAPTGRFLVPQYDTTDPEYIFSTMFIIASKLAAASPGVDLATRALLQAVNVQATAAGPDGGVAFSDQYPYYYTNLAGLALVALTVGALMEPPAHCGLYITPEGAVALSLSFIPSGATARAEYALGSTAPDPSSPAWALLGESSTEATLTSAPLPPGSLVWVRLRSQMTGADPGGWTAPDGVQT